MAGGNEAGDRRSLPGRGAAGDDATRTIRLSLVVSTLGRGGELIELLDNLTRQTIKDFEVIIVDQNDDDDLVRLPPAGSLPFAVRHLRTAGERGLSRGRNVGWRQARGPVVLFPDDDTLYPPTFLEMGLAGLERLGCDALAGRADERGRFARRPQRIRAANAWTTSVEWAVFFRKPLLAALGGYDESLGVGATTPWQACEGQDLLLRALEADFVCCYDPALVGAYLKSSLGKGDGRVRDRARAYARGMGYVLRRHRYPLHMKLWWLLRPLGGSALSLLRGRSGQARYYAAVAIGRFEGMRGRIFGLSIQWAPHWTA